MKFVILFLVLIFIFAISITLGANNDQTVTFNYLIAQDDFRLSTLFAVLFGAGFIIGWLLTGIFYLRVKLKLGATQRKLKKVQKMYDEQISERQKSELTASTITTK